MRQQLPGGISLHHHGSKMHIDTELDCGLCLLRPISAEDIPSLSRQANDPKVAAWLRDRFPHPYTTKDGLRFLEYITSTQEECVAGTAVAGEIVGAVGVQFRTDIERCSAELGYWIGQEFWGRGLATAAIRCFTTWAMHRFQLTRIYAEVFTGNPASARVLEKAGFERIGTLRKAALKRGVHHDYSLYDLVR